MATIENTNKTLFLHGGPGLHAAVERAWFGDSLPVIWWDQPVVAADDQTAFLTLVDHATKRFHALAASTGGPVDIIAHSYGSLIAAALAEEYPALIRRVTLLGCPSLNPFHPFLCLGQKLLEAGYERPRLQEAMKAAEENPSESKFTVLIQALFPEPSLPDIYFGPGSAAAKNRYKEHASTAPPIDLATFFAVMLDLLHTTHFAQPVDFNGEVLVLLGKHDPVLHIEDCTEKWRKIFPQAQFKLVDAGHMLHLELPAETWLAYE